MSSAWKWFGVRTVYRTAPRGRPKGKDRLYSRSLTLVEERVVLFRARNFDEAIKKAEREAAEYASNLRHTNPYGQAVATRYLGYCDAYEMFEDEPKSGVEVFSETEVVPQKASDKSVLSRMIGYREPVVLSRRRRNFLDIVFNAPAPGVQLSKEDLAFVQRYGTLRRKADA